MEALTDLGKNTYQWEMAKIGTDQFNLQTVYASKYVSSKKDGTIVWTPVEAEGSVITQSFLSTTAGPTGRVCSYPVVPAPAPPYPPQGAPALSPGIWRIQLRTHLGGPPSADSNGIEIEVLPLSAEM